MKKKINDLRECRPNNTQSIERTAFAFLDIETSGLYPERGARITEIAIHKRGAIRFLWNKSQSKNQTVDNTLASQLSLVSDHLRTGVVVGHNVGFDLRFIAYEADRLNSRGPNVLFIDTLHLAKKICTNFPDYKLSSLLDVFDISAEGSLHTAIVDARCTRALFWKLINKGEIETLSQAGMQQLNWSTF